MCVRLRNVMRPKRVKAPVTPMAAPRRVKLAIGPQWMPGRTRSGIPMTPDAIQIGEAKRPQAGRERTATPMRILPTPPRVARCG